MKRKLEIMVLPAVLIFIIAGTSYLAAAEGVKETVSGRRKAAYHKRLTKMLADPRRCTEELRPRFHFTPLFNWTNDPNGLVYYQGEYHLFFQHNPFGREWGNMSWGHAVSRDLVYWEQLPIALWPDELGTIFSGSGVVDRRNTAGFQTGEENTIVVAYTYAGQFGKPERPYSQAIAYSNDRGRTWTKYRNNPVLPNQSGGNDRDPRLLWHEPTKQWVMVLYLEAGRRLGFYTSPNLKEWTYASEIHGFHECPDLFELPVDGDPGNTRWVVLGADSDYLIGWFDGRTFTRESGKHRGDYGHNFYASQTFSNIPVEDGRRIQIAWMAGGEYPRMPFNQQMSFPCELTLRTFPEGIRMCRNPVREIEKLHVDEFSLADRILSPGENPLEGIAGDLFDIRMEIELAEASEFGLRIHEARVRYYVSDHTITCLGATAPLNPVSGRIKLKILVDRTSIEIFGNDGRVSMSSCFLPEEDPETDIGLYAAGGEARIVSLKVYKLRSAWLPRGAQP